MLGSTSDTDSLSVAQSKVFLRRQNVAKACLADGPDFQMVFVPPPRSHISLVYVDRFMLELPFKIFTEENDNREKYRVPQKKFPIAIFREAIVQKIPEFYEMISQTGQGGQSDFISLIQK